MKKILILVLALSPTLVRAQELSDEAAMTLRTRNPLPTHCAKFSDMECWGRSVHSFCIRDPQRGQTGTCLPVDWADADGSVSCRCF